MTRQKMLNKITDYFCSKSKDTPVVMADEVLKLVEELGMLPPLVEKGTPWYSIKNDYDGQMMPTRLGRDVNEWEPEDV